MRKEGLGEGRETAEAGILDYSFLRQRATMPPRPVTLIWVVWLAIHPLLVSLVIALRVTRLPADPQPDLDPASTWLLWTVGYTVGLLPACVFVLTGISVLLKLSRVRILFAWIATALSFLLIAASAQNVDALLGVLVASFLAMMSAVIVSALTLKG